MNVFLTCQDVLRLIPDYEEDRLSMGLRMRMKVHLNACKPCMAMLESLRTLPGILRNALAEKTPNGPPSQAVEARKALDAAMARLQAGGRMAPGTFAAPLSEKSLYKHRPAHPIPDVILQSVSAGTADLPLRLMAEAYQAIQERGGALPREPFLPDSVLKELPRSETWKWTKTLLNGCSTAFLAKDAESGTSLHMILLPPGRSFPDHLHRGEEDVVLLAGQAENTRDYGSAGDWFHHERGSEHRSLQGRGEDACWALGRMEGPGVLLHGWRGVVQSLVERS